MLAIDLVDQWTIASLALASTLAVAVAYRTSRVFLRCSLGRRTVR